MSSDYENFIVEKKNNIAYVTFNRPYAMNALNSPLGAELDQIITELTDDDEIHGVIFTGAGDKAFIAGADIKELSTLNAVQGKMFAEKFQRLYTRVENMPKPTIAAINGFCLGIGCEFAMCCHIRIASNKAKFGQPEVHLGLIPGAMGTIRLPRLVGKGRALELLLTGKPISADDAYRIGLVNHVVEPDQLIPKCEEILGDIFKQGPLAIRFVIESVNNGLNMPTDEGGNFEANLFGLCFSTEDGKEGLSAFIEKRNPSFKRK